MHRTFLIFFSPLRKFFQSLALLAVIATASSVSAKTITFEALACGAAGAAIPNGYEGLNWTNFWCVNGTTFPGNPSGYVNGLVSGNNVALNFFANPATFAFVAPSGARFNLVSMNLTGAWKNNLSVKIQTFRAGVAVTDTTTIVQSTGPTLVNINAANIDTVTMSSSGGVDAGYVGVGTQFVLDDLVITDLEMSPASVPTLSDWALLLLIGLMFAAVCRQRKFLTPPL